MVVNEKALVREMKEAYRGFGYSVMVTPEDHWVIGRNDAWTVEIEGQDNVPNEVLALIVLHMGKLPRPEQSFRIYKDDKCTIVQKEVFSVEAENLECLHRMRDASYTDPITVVRTPIVYGRRRLWQNKEDKQVILILPRFEGLMEPGAESVIRRVGEQICLEGGISSVYISRARGGANENILDHLAKVSWT